MICPPPKRSRRWVVFPLSLSMVLGCVLLPQSALGKRKRVPYTTDGDCGGYPKLKVKTPPGMCLGLVMQGGFKKPRAMVSISPTELLVADMGGWVRNRGSIWRVKLGPKVTKEKILHKVDWASDIVLRDGYVYVATPTRIFRFPADAEKPADQIEDVITGLPGQTQKGGHPLKIFLIDEAGNMVINVGSSTDNCQADKGKPLCAEAEGREGRGVIRLYESPLESSRWRVLARGLRNSMVIISDALGRLVQIENSRDHISRADPKLDHDTLPHEELNIIVPGGHYGWPYCYDAQVPSPEFPAYDCKKTIAPALMLPAHAAPLGAMVYTGGMLPSWYEGKLLVTYHGYHANGHRLVVIPTDATGVYQTPQDVVWGWGKTKTNPRGAPVGMATHTDGSIFIADDKNRAILRLFYDPAKGDGLPEAVAPALEALPPVGPPDKSSQCPPMPSNPSQYERLHYEVWVAECGQCHGDPKNHGGNLYLDPCSPQATWAALLTGGPDDLAWIRPGELAGEFVDRLRGGARVMPPTQLNKTKLSLVEEWIKAGAPKP